MGLGLLLANRWREDQRRAIGWTLLLVGVISTVPLALEILGKRVRSNEDSSSEPDMSRSESQFVPQEVFP
jgi:hypothetical protein